MSDIILLQSGFESHISQPADFEAIWNIDPSMCGDVDPFYLEDVSCVYFCGHYRPSVSGFSRPRGLRVAYEVLERNVGGSTGKRTIEQSAAV